MINSGQKFGLVQNYLVSKNEVCEGNHRSASSNSKVEKNNTGNERKYKLAEKKDTLDTPHLILYILDILIFIVAAALIYSFGKDIYNKIQKRNEVPLVGSGTSKDF